MTFIPSAHHADVLIRADIGVKHIGSAASDLHSEGGTHRTRQQKEPVFVQTRAQVFRNRDTVGEQLRQADFAAAARAHSCEIARVAIRLADEEGLAGVTIQRLAREVGLTTMALYRYFPAKADLVALMIDSASDSPLHFGKPSLPWSTRLKEWARRCLAIYKDHILDGIRARVRRRSR